MRNSGNPSPSRAIPLKPQSLQMSKNLVMVRNIILALTNTNHVEKSITQVCPQIITHPTIFLFQKIKICSLLPTLYKLTCLEEILLRLQWLEHKNQFVTHLQHIF